MLLQVYGFICVENTVLINQDGVMEHISPTLNWGLHKVGDCFVITPNIAFPIDMKQHLQNSTMLIDWISTAPFAWKFNSDITYKMSKILYRKLVHYEGKSLLRSGNSDKQ